MEPGLIVLLVLTGIIVGLGQGLLGVGGAFIMVPVMVAVFDYLGWDPDLAVKTAFGTSLLVIFPAAIATTVAHHRLKAVRWKAAVVMGAGGVAGSLLGATLTTRIIGGEIMKIVFGVVVILASIRLLTAKPLESREPPRENPLLWVVFGFLVGMFSGLLGAGGGILMVPVMVMLLRFRMHQAVATSAAVMVFTSGAGAVGYFVNGLHVSGLPGGSLGYFSLTAWLCLAPTSIAMTQAGTWVAHRLSGKALRTVFVIVMVVVGVKMLGAF
ncbi:MAG: sulfite exporter TauE/SafE family protein [Dehalococcoidia bacterium]|nr:sulfite exporter TauE/SafE family protein [Dehalococcoidia bacterium]